MTKFGNSLSLSFFHLPNENDDTSFMALLKQEKTGNVDNIMQDVDVKDTSNLCLLHCFTSSGPPPFIVGVV